MPGYVTKEEFRALSDEVEGEKLVTRYILKQTQANGNDLATIKKHVEGVDLKALVRDIRDLQVKVGNIDAKLTGLIHTLPRIIAEALRKDRSSGRRKKT